MCLHIWNWSEKHKNIFLYINVNKQSMYRDRVESKRWQSMRDAISKTIDKLLSIWIYLDLDNFSKIHKNSEKNAALNFFGSSSGDHQGSPCIKLLTDMNIQHHIEICLCTSCRACHHIFRIIHTFSVGSLLACVQRKKHYEAWSILPGIT